MTALLITDRPDHPVLHQVLTLLEAGNGVAVLDPGDPVEVVAVTARLASHPPDVVLLKSHDDAAIEVGRAAVRSGVRVLNDPDATAASLDRVQMARIAATAGVPFPVTSRPFRFGDAGERAQALAELDLAGGDLAAHGLLVKSRRSRRGDLVTRVTAVAELDALAGDWPDEEVVLQPAAAFDGWDHKVWVVGDEIFHARRRTPLTPLDGDSPDGVSPGGVPAEWVDLVRRVGRVYGLCIFGVDLLATPEGPLVVDVNPFPGGRSVAGVAEAIARLAGPLAALPWLHAQVAAQVSPETGSEGVPEQGRPRVVSVRAKPGRGVVVGYEARGRRLTARLTARSGVPEVFWFPQDPDLPALAAVMAPSAQLAAAVERAAPGVPGRRLAGVAAVRYKPGDRCVVRFDLSDSSSVFGKLVATAEAAVEADRIHRLAWDAAAGGDGSPWVARPLAVLADLGLTLVEGVPGRPPRTPDELLDGARLLATMHSCGSTAGLPVRGLGPDLRRLRERAAALQVPDDLAERLAEALQDAVAGATGTGPVLTHGAFKPSQLVTGPGRTVVVDLDGVAAGDPARDLGYLCAYLRSPLLQRDAFAVEVTRAYAEQRRRSGGTSPAQVAADVRRAGLYEAATLFKIAHRRVNRCQAPRPGERAALHREVAALLDGWTSGGSA